MREKGFTKQYLFIQNSQSKIMTNFILIQIYKTSTFTSHCFMECKK